MSYNNRDKVHGCLLGGNQPDDWPQISHIEQMVRRGGEREVLLGGDGTSGLLGLFWNGIWFIMIRHVSDWPHISQITQIGCEVLGLVWKETR
jgi:hypothetical protein